MAQNPNLNVVEQALLDGAVQFLKDHPEFLQKVVALGMNALSGLILTWLTGVVARFQTPAAPSASGSMPTA